MVNSVADGTIVVSEEWNLERKNTHLRYKGVARTFSAGRLAFVDELVADSFCQMQFRRRGGAGGGGRAGGMGVVGLLLALTLDE